MKTPRPILVTVSIAPSKRNGLTKPIVGARVGGCNTLEEAREMIAKDRREMSGTLGGLIDAPGTAGRTYRVFQAKWTEVSVCP